MARCALCLRTVYAEDLLTKRPGCTFCKGYVPENDLVSMLEAYERAWIVFALRQQDGVKNRAAKMLGIGRTTLVEKMKRLRISVTITEGPSQEMFCDIDIFSGFV